MELTKKYFSCLLLFGLCIPLFAQQSRLEQEVNESIKRQVFYVVDAFTTHLEYIADKSKPDSIKDYRIDALLDLFIGRGDATNDSEGQEIIPAPRIEVLDMRTGAKIYTVKPFLKRLKHLNYKNFYVKNVEIFIRFLSKTADGRCEAILEHHIVALNIVTNQLEYLKTNSKTQRIRVNNCEFPHPTERIGIYIGNVQLQIGK